jgi:1-deoxy-D-xylulose-5-phosphate synthase
MKKILDKVNKPGDLEALDVKELIQLSGEVRELIIDSVSKTGGHLAANLGVVELTIALLKTFRPPDDKIIWDVSHQCYTYKILTERKDRIHTLRQRGGLSGFLKREESPYDAFGAGHAGTALSAALGMAAARDRMGGDEHVVAIIGDAAAGCGPSLEALNNLADVTRRLIVILNDNEMSISENVGAMSRYLGGLLANPRYNRWKKSVESVATKMHMGWLRSVYYRIEEAVKSLFLSSVMFEEFGLRYVGPIDGHDFDKLLDAMKIARDSDRPIVLHVSTQKGKGYTYAEEQPAKWHGTSCFEVASGEGYGKAKGTTYSSVFGSTVEQLAKADDRIVAITAAMCDGTGLSRFAKKFPERFFDVGISEEHGALFAAGLAAKGLRPVFAVYSTFSQRVVDCIIHDICLQKLPVIMCLDRAGAVGDDGPTHHGVFDIVLYRSVPDLIMMQPKDEAELANMLATAFSAEKPVIIRYPRGTGPGTPVPEKTDTLEIGKAEVLKSGHAVQIWALGDMIPIAEEAAGILAKKNIEAGIVNPRFIRPLDTDLLKKQAADAKVFITMENGTVAGGFGSSIQEFLASSGFGGRVIPFGWPDQFVPHGSVDILRKDFGLTAKSVANAVEAGLPQNSA